MKVRCGVNPDYADFDELDMDAEEAKADFRSGSLSYDGLRAMIGSEEASFFADSVAEDDFYLDDPEDF